MEGGSLYSGMEYAEDKGSCVSSLLEQSLGVYSFSYIWFNMPS